jgi:hypothetical protein
VTFSNPIASALGRLVREALQSADYVPGAGGWRLSRDGSAELGAVTVRGRVDASSGSFAGDLTAGTVNKRKIPTGWVNEGSGDADIGESGNVAHVLASIQQKLTGGRLYRLEGEVFQALVSAGTAVDLTLRGDVAAGVDALTLPRLNAKRVEANVGQVVTTIIQPDTTAVWDLVFTAHRSFGTGSWIVRARPTARCTLTLFDVGALPPIP